MFEEWVEQALSSAEPLERLRELASRLLTQGYDKSALLKMFDETRQLFRQTNREAEEDVVMEVMDFLVGWCSPHAKLPAD